MQTFFRVLAVFASMTPAAIRAGLWLKSLRPASPVGGWSVAIAAGMHLIVYWILFVALNQMCGNALLFVAAVCMIAGPVVYLIGYQWLLEPAGQDSFRRILMARSGHWLIFAAGLALFVVYFFTKSFDPLGEFWLFGFSAERSLIRPGTALAMLMDFVARTFATSIVALDLIEQIHRTIEKTANDDMNK
jgi:hypothetical protein